MLISFILQPDSLASTNTSTVRGCTFLKKQKNWVRVRNSVFYKAHFASLLYLIEMRYDTSDVSD